MTSNIPTFLYYPILPAKPNSGRHLPSTISPLGDISPNSPPNPGDSALFQKTKCPSSPPSPFRCEKNRPYEANTVQGSEIQRYGSEFEGEEKSGKSGGMDGGGGIDVDTISRFCFFGGFGSVSYPTPLPPLSSLPSFFLWDQFIHSFIRFARWMGKR